MEPEQQDQQRKDLAHLLRRLRRAAGLSGERLADRCAMSQSKVSRIERGKALPTVLDVELIIQALGVPADLATELLTLARAANFEYVSDRVLSRTGFTQKQADLKKLEASSTTIRYFLPAVPTGLLQIPDYARSALTPTVRPSDLGDVDRII